MCGICGAIQIHGEPREVLSDRVLRRMTRAMVHRGPDDEGTYVAPGVAIGARRLSIIDVEGGHQPFSDESGRVWGAQNGEIYNHAALRSVLQGRGHRFKSHCDTEIIPHVYNEYGTDFPLHLRGMYAMVVWDDVRRRGMLVRDRLGIKPLYVAECGDLLLFASELKCLLASGMVEDRLDFEAIDAYLTLGFFPAPMTPLAGVRKLMPGQTVTVEDGKVSYQTYWKFPVPTEGPRLDVGEHAARILDKLRETVRMRLMSDVPLGAMLSGGLDSSLIVALMAEMMDEPIKTFSVGFVDSADNELSDAQTVSKLYGTDHHVLELSIESSKVSIEDLVWHLDEPLADLSALGFIGLCGLAREHVTVALSGQGADELLGGYRKHRAASIAESFERVPRVLRSGLRPLARWGPAALRRPASTLSARDAAERLIAMSGNLSPAARARIVRHPALAKDDSAARRVLLGYEDTPEAPLAATLYLDARLGLVDDMLTYFDRASMAHSLEVRVPFLDHEFVELCATIPTDLKVRRGVTKYLLKEAARGLVPDRIIDKRKIGFFNASVDNWFVAQGAALASDYLLEPSARYGEFLDRDQVSQMLEVHKARDARSEYGYPLLSVLMLEVWLTKYLPRAMSAGEPE